MFTESVLSSLKSGYFTLIFNFYGNKLLGSDEKTEKLNSETKSLKRLIFLGKVLPSLQLSPHSAVPLIFFCLFNYFSFEMNLHIIPAPAYDCSR